MFSCADVDTSRFFLCWEGTNPSDAFFVADVDAFFMRFSQEHPRLTPTQIRFLDLLKNHISRYGLIEVEKLWEAPFTTLSSDGLSGVFEEKEQDEILQIVKQINLESSQP